MNRREVAQLLMLAPFSSVAATLPSPPTNLTVDGKTANISGSPNIAALPLADNSIGDWNNFPGPAWATNSPWTDITGAVLRRLTSPTGVGSDSLASSYCGFEYASNGPLISRAFGTNADTYHMLLWVTGGPSSAYVFDYQRGVGVLAGSLFVLPIGQQESLCSAFSMYPGDSPHILYISDRGSPSAIHRYNCQTRAYEPNAVFSGQSASVPAGGNTSGWLTMNWSGSHLVWMSPYASPTTISSLDIASGVRTDHAAGSINEIKVQKGATKIVTYVAGGSGGRRFWFVDTNVVTAAVSGNSTQTHSNCGESNYYIFNANDGNMPLNVYTPGSAPATDGGAWTGTETNLYGSGGGTQTFDSDHHPCMAWDQTGSGANEWYCIGVATTDAGQSDKTSAAGWTLYSGNVYRTKVNYSTPYGAASIGVSAVITKTGSNYTGKLTMAASLAAIAAGQFWWDGTYCYAWMPTGVNPTGLVRLVAQPPLGESVGYVRATGTERRRLCFTYRNDNVYVYGQDCYSNWSPDGKIVAFASNFGVPGGRTDLVCAEVPLA